MQLVLRSKDHIGPIATGHPSGPDSAFTVTERIPPATATGPATILVGSAAGSVRLVLRP